MATLLTIASIAAAAQPPASTMPDAAARTVESLQPVIVPISGPLGLADIGVAVRADQLPAGSRLSIMLERRSGQVVEVRMQLGPSAPDGPLHFSARVMAAEAAASEISQAGSPPLRFRLAVTDHLGRRTLGPEQTLSAAPAGGHATPDWAKGAVWYQIFVERFRNGNAANDPRPPEYYLAPWNSAWSTVTADELDLARARAAELPMPQSLAARRRGGQLGNVLSSRRYGGDLEGVVEKLDELKELGVTAIYFNPIFHAHSHHKYDATDYRHIDPTFAGPGRSPDEAASLARETPDAATWTLTAADRYFLETLIPEAHRRGLRVILDGVWNHVGLEHWAFQDIVARGTDSPYKDWFQCTFATEADFPDWRNSPLDVRPGRLISWKSWGGEGRNGGLPEFARNRATGRLHPEVERYIFDCTRRWTAAIDGWRLDVVPDLPMPFWRAWSDLVRTVNPDAALYAEVWFDAKDYFASPTGTDAAKIFDGQMNYPFAFPAVRWLAGEAGMPSDKLITQLSRAFTHAPQHDLVQMNLFGSHDTERLASMLTNPGREYDQQGSVASNPRYDASRPSAEIYRRVALAAALQSLHLGSPMVYYGDEYGMYGADDPASRQPLPWPDRGPYEDPTVAADTALREQFRSWLRLRSDPEIGPLLRYGAIRYLASGNPDVFVFERSLNGVTLIAAFNRSPSSAADLRALLPATASRRIPAEEKTPSTVPPLAAAAWVITTLP
jgi:glycosidase